MVKTVKNIQIYARRNAILVISPLLLMLRNSQSVINYFGLRCVFGIQRRGFDPTDNIFLQGLSGINPTQFQSLIQKPDKRIVFSLLHNYLESPEHSDIQTHTDHQTIHLIPSKNFQESF